jgi:hypothetical protein
MSINYYARCAPHTTINPKENKKKNGKKKRKKKAIISRVLGLVCKVFGKKILPLLSIKKQLQKKRVWRFFLQNTF